MEHQHKRMTQTNALRVANGFPPLTADDFERLMRPAGYREALLNERQRDIERQQYMAHRAYYYGARPAGEPPRNEDR